MKIVTRARASAVIYDVLVSKKNEKTWLLPANCCPIVPLTFLKAKVNYELSDINFSDLCLDQGSVLEKIRKAPASYSGIVFIDTYGYPALTTELFKSIKANYPYITIIHDKCQGIPDSKHTPYSDVTLHSTGYAKYVDLSYGGYATVNDNITLSSTTLSYSEQALKEIDRQYKESIKTKNRFHYEDSNWLETGELPVKNEDYFEKIEQEKISATTYKKQLNSVYETSLPKEIQCKAAFQGWRFNILVPEKAELLASVFAEKLFASSHYQSLGGVFSDALYPNAELLGSAAINLFNDRYFSEAQAIQLCDIINRHYKKRGALPKDSPLQNIIA